MKEMDAIDTEEVLKTLECPFTWDMEDVLTLPQERDVPNEEKNDDKNDDNHDDDDKNDDDDDGFFQLEKFMKRIMYLYLDVKMNVDDHIILATSKKSDQIFAKLNKSPHPEITVKVLKYVLQATQCFMYNKLKMLSELKDALSDIMNVKFTIEKDQSTLSACRGICWSSFHEKFADKAIECIREAIQKNSQCDLWYFILAKNLRRQRRYICFSYKNIKEEKTSFIKAYELSQNPIYEVFLAQIYREIGKRNKALSLYESAFDKKPNNVSVLLRIALGFTRLKEFAKAQECFNIIEEQNLGGDVYYHYLGIFNMEQEKYQEARIFLLKAIENTYNFCAEKDLIKCEVLLDNNFSTTDYLTGMLKKYETLPPFLRQPLFLDLAMCYWKQENNIRDALHNFLKAMEINPKAKCLTNYFDYLKITKDKNIFKILTKYIFKELKNNSTISEDDKRIADKLKAYTDDYYKQNPKESYTRCHQKEDFKKKINKN